MFRIPMHLFLYRKLIPNITEMTERAVKPLRLTRHEDTCYRHLLVVKGRTKKGHRYNIWKNIYGSLQKTQGLIWLVVVVVKKMQLVMQFILFSYLKSGCAYAMHLTCTMWHINIGNNVWMISFYLLGFDCIMIGY